MISQYMIVLTIFLTAIFVDVYSVRKLERNGNLNTNNSDVKSTTSNPRKWIQQNNIWIRNEQAAFSPAVNSNQQSSKDRNLNSNQQPVRDRNVNSQANLNQQELRPQDGNSNQPGFRRRIISSNPQGFMGSPNSTQNVSKGLPKTVENDNKNQNPIVALPKKVENDNKKQNPVVALPKKVENDNKKQNPIVALPKNVENDNKNQNTVVVKDGDVSDEELREFSETLLQKDTNNAMQYVTLNLQGMTTSRSPDDAAPLPLLTLKEDTYKIPSIEKIMLLYNNYFLDAGQNEVYTGQERIEENNLLDTVLATPVMQYARNFLIQKGKIGKDPKEFKDLLRLIWFNMYSRGQGRIGSSGFEHVFLVEIKNNQVSGLHNWLYFYEQEKQKRANYLGYLKKIDLGEKGAIVKYHFTFDDIDKPVGSMFIGTSPELEMALYTTCFILRADKICPLKMNQNKFIIRTYTYRYRGKNMIGSAFPEI